MIFFQVKGTATPKSSRGFLASDRVRQIGFQSKGGGGCHSREDFHRHFQGCIPISDWGIRASRGHVPPETAPRRHRSCSFRNTSTLQGGAQSTRD